MKGKMTGAEMGPSKECVEQRKGWSIESDHDYYYYRGKLDATRAIAQFIRDNGGSSRTLSYNYLKVEYMDAVTDALTIANFVHDHTPDPFREATGGIEEMKAFYSSAMPTKERDEKK